MRKRIGFLSIALITLLIMLVPAGSAFAFTTTQTWTFDAEVGEEVEYAAESFTNTDTSGNSVGTPVFEQFGGTYHSTYQGATGVWLLDEWSAVDFIVPNLYNENMVKEVTFTATYYTADGGSISTDSWIYAEDDQGMPLEDDAVEFYQSSLTDNGDGWYTATWVGTITPQPEIEDFAIFVDGTIYLSEVTIATSCVPVPSSIAMLILGLLGFTGIIRKRQ